MDVKFFMHLNNNDVAEIKFNCENQEELILILMLSNPLSNDWSTSENAQIIISFSTFKNPNANSFIAIKSSHSDSLDIWRLDPIISFVF